MRVKAFIYTVGIFIVILLQTTVLDYIKINDVKPNLILVCTLCLSILEGSTGGAIIGLFLGLVQDIVSGKVLGFYAIMGMYLGAIGGLANKRFYKDNYIVVSFFTFILTIAYEISVYLFSGFGSLRPRVVFAFKKIVLPEALYNSILSVFIYYIILKINDRVSSENKATR